VPQARHLGISQALRRTARVVSSCAHRFRPRFGFRWREVEFRSQLAARQKCGRRPGARSLWLAWQTSRPPTFSAPSPTAVPTAGAASDRLSGRATRPKRAPPARQARTGRRTRLAARKPSARKPQPALARRPLAAGARRPRPPGPPAPVPARPAPAARRRSASRSSRPGTLQLRSRGGPCPGRVRTCSGPSFRQRPRSRRSAFRLAPAPFATRSAGFRVPNAGHEPRRGRPPPGSIYCSSSSRTAARPRAAGGGPTCGPHSRRGESVGRRP
jgi:hypothetical protein